MALYALGDTHLAIGKDKPMDVFGPVWENHTEKLRQGFSKLNDDDLCVLCGDLSWGMGLEDTLEERRLIALLNRFLAELPREARIVFVKRYWYLSSVREIAEQMGMSEGKVKMTLYRTRKKLKSRMKEENYL